MNIECIYTFDTRSRMKFLLLALGFFVSGQIIIAKYAGKVLSVDSYGAIANDSSVQAAVKNSQAISQASIFVLRTMHGQSGQP